MSEKYENRMWQLLLLLLALTMFSLWMLSNLYAKYVTTAESMDSARVAAFIVNDTNDLQKTYEIYPSMSGNEQKSITVTVKNSSEVAVRYTFSFETDGNLPLQITGSGPEGVALQKKEGDDTWTTEKTAGASWDETYTFTLSLPNENGSYQYAGGVESIRLTVKAEQID